MTPKEISELLKTINTKTREAEENYATAVTLRSMARQLLDDSDAYIAKSKFQVAEVKVLMAECNHQIDQLPKQPNCKFCEFPDHEPDVYDAPEEVREHVMHLLRTESNPSKVFGFVRKAEKLLPGGFEDV